jgi:hypothetical protein
MFKILFNYNTFLLFHELDDIFVFARLLFFCFSFCPCHGPGCSFLLRRQKKRTKEKAVQGDTPKNPAP